MLDRNEVKRTLNTYKLITEELYKILSKLQENHLIAHLSYIDIWDIDNNIIELIWVNRYEDKKRLTFPEEILYDEHAQNNYISNEINKYKDEVAKRAEFEYKDKLALYNKLKKELGI